MSGNVCKFCGLHDISNMDGAVYYACGSSCYDISGAWEQSLGCVEILDLRNRIAEAIDKSQRAIRFGLERDSTIRCMFANDMDRVIAILEGNSPKNLEGST